MIYEQICTEARNLCRDWMHGNLINLTSALRGKIATILNNTRMRFLIRIRIEGSRFTIVSLVVKLAHFQKVSELPDLAANHFDRECKLNSN